MTSKLGRSADISLEFSKLGLSTSATVLRCPCDDFTPRVFTKASCHVWIRSGPTIDSNFLEHLEGYMQHMVGPHYDERLSKFENQINYYFLRE